MAKFKIKHIPDKQNYIGKTQKSLGFFQQILFKVKHLSHRIINIIIRFIGRILATNITPYQGRS